MEQRYDVAVIGGGIVGLSLAAALLDRRPQLRLALLEKESGLGEHQTGHNSGVLHSGIYYQPGSLKAQLCVEGARRMAEFCALRGLPIARLGKVIVATEEAELPRLAELYKRGVANGVPGLEMLDPKQLRAIEPHAFGLQAIHCPTTAAVDFQRVAWELARDIRARGAEILTQWPVKRIRTSIAGWRIESGADWLTTHAFVNCGGLHADTIATLSGMKPDVQVVPFRGEYFKLSPEGAALVRGLIYPVPDPRLPFLGVHLTRHTDGGVDAGPNALLSMGRETYRKHSVSIPDVLRFVAYPGFWRMARKHWKTAGLEMRRSMHRSAFVRSVQRMVPDIRDQDLEPGGCGIRAQAVARDGSLVDDFRLIETPGAIHVLNAPSPAATASLAIASRLADMAIQTFRL
jgi:L-2-hydroxyglutarate oxidase LhgO